MATRTETDSMGPIEVETERYWGAQTQRSLGNFRIGGERMPRELVHALAMIKKDHKAPGTKVTLDAGAVKYTGKTSSLPWHEKRPPV